MTSPFDAIPDVAIDYVRAVFGAANEKVSTTMSLHPSMHEESLDHVLIMELTASAPAFFAQEQVGISLESHWLGARWMHGRWEIADIAFFILLRRRGHLIARKVALLQTKRLYSREIAVVPVDETDYRIGIGRLADRTEQSVPISSQRIFGFDNTSVYQATQAGHRQIDHIDEYFDLRGIPIYYGFYNPLTLPFQTSYPALNGQAPVCGNEIGFRVMPAEHVHTAVRRLVEGRSPSINDITAITPLDAADARSTLGWRLERFIADEVLRCRQGRMFEDLTDTNLRGLLYERSAPIAAAITITIDLSDGG
ncbi:hypothetical protein HFO55_25280 [Rhizobium leguminosarum]|uniref:hypothetical protein n=1 Tax=Rhizobium leguminosarum TaxID=384 RepID=UPI001C93B677|nr:hypothetical protein [Rhizobium leguminosarum]MBY5570523.1 hypothetical protein [Rhizobium leguminosarum]MBY5576996.1 hypothetical protein [Rhizobium leguminosarum]